MYVQAHMQGCQGICECQEDNVHELFLSYYVVQEIKLRLSDLTEKSSCWL